MNPNTHQTPKAARPENIQEKLIHPKSGIPVLLFHFLASIAAVVLIVIAAVNMDGAHHVLMIVGGIVYITIIAPCFFAGLRSLKPNEALVFTYFGKYSGTLKGPGFFYVNIFHSAFNPSVIAPTSAKVASAKSGGKADDDAAALTSAVLMGKKISLKTKTINNNKQKVNDLLGNPIIVDTMVLWRISDTAKAMFSVDNYMEFLSVQCDAALRDLVSKYPYDSPDESNVKSLRCSTQEIVDALKAQIQETVTVAGLEIVDARITNLYYSPEIATAMLQRQQASAVVDAKHTIVEGAVDIVEMALRRLNANGIVHLDEERKAAMVSNLLVVLCSGKDTQPVVNSGSLY